VSVCPADETPLRADATIADGAHMHDAPADPLVGRVLDEKYRLDARLGEGGMGTVYRATHLLIDRPVAVKVLTHHFVEDEAAQARFRREARAAGRLQHPNVAAVTDFGQTADGLVYIVMELLEGRSLRELLTTEAPLDVARAASLMLQVAAAVGAAHEAGVIHRDLKPGNIFIVQRHSLPPVVKVLDFGIAKLAADATEEFETHALTQTGVMIGTPRYMSPEQCDGARLTPASDVYSLGIIFYEMLTDETPFNGATPLAVAVQHSSKPPRRPRELRPAIPNALEDLTLRALAKDPAARPADAGAFRRELYETVQRLGLEHAAEFSAPTSDMLRAAGTETPSGRLVLDLERLREQRAARPRDTTVLADTGGASQRAAAGARRVLTEVPPIQPRTNGRAHPFTRLRIMIRQQKEQHQIRRVAPLALAGAFVLLMLLVGAAALVQPGFERAPVSMQSNGEPRPVPTPTATPAPTPSPSPTPDQRDKKREEKKPARRQEQKDGSKLGGVVNQFKKIKKIKKIFKNPF
jgi:serine/threonine-protein kinase